MNLAMLIATVTPTDNQFRKYAVWRKTGGRCFYCGNKLIFGRMHLAIDSSFHDLSERELFVQYMTTDHGTPFERGGSGGFDDLFPACRQCNAQKGTMNVVEYHAWLLRQGLTPRFLPTKPREPDTANHDYLLVSTEHAIMAEVTAGHTYSRGYRTELSARDPSYAQMFTERERTSREGRGDLA